MFNCCTSLTSLDLSSFNTQNVKNMFCMFSGCSSLTTINLSSFNTENADTSFMFDYCKNLLSYEISDQKIVKAFINKAE